MERKGAIIAAILVWVIYPLLTVALVMAVLLRDPIFTGQVEPNAEAKAAAAAEAAANPYGLTEWEMQHGIGPITEPVELGDIDPNLAKKGEQAFKTKCGACHKMDKRYVGPPLRGVVVFRGPEYVMNMMLNPAEMIEKHPIAKGLFQQYLTVMTPQNVTEEDARAIVEYLRKDFEDSQKAGTE